MHYNKVRAGSGAQWLLDAIALVRGNFLALGGIGLVYGLLAVIPFVSLLATVLGVVLVAGILLAVREADTGGRPGIGHLFAGFTSGRIGRLLFLLLLAVVFMLAVSVALALMVGGEGIALMQRIIESTPDGGSPDPALIAQLPAGPILGWFALTFLLGVLAWLYTFFYLPLVMFNDAGIRQALATGMRASAANIGALLVYVLVMLVFAVAALFAMLLVAFVLGLVVGPTAAELVSSVLLSAVMVPISTAAVYYAWKQVFGADAAAPTSTTHGLEA